LDVNENWKVFYMQVIRKLHVAQIAYNQACRNEKFKKSTLMKK